MDWPILVIVAAVLVALALYGGRARRTDVHRWFAIQTLTLASWVLGIAGTHSGHLPEFWGRWTFASASLMPAAFLAFTRVFPELSSWPSALLVRVVLSVGGILACLAAGTALVAHDFVITASGTLHRQPGPLFPLFT